MDFHDTFDKRQPDACAFDVGIELFKQGKDAGLIALFDTDAVVLYKNDRFVFCLAGPDLNEWAGLCAAVFDGIIDQVFEDLPQAGPVAIQVWKR